MNNSCVLQQTISSPYKVNKNVFRPKFKIGLRSLANHGMLNHNYPALAHQLFPRIITYEQQSNQNIKGHTQLITKMQMHNFKDLQKLVVFACSCLGIVMNCAQMWRVYLDVLGRGHPLTTRYGGQNGIIFQLFQNNKSNAR